jgi:hypothetical protein
MAGGMTIQMLFFLAAVLVCVAWTKLVYIDGMRQQLLRMRRHCMMHAGMISGVCVWAMAMGFNLHHKQESVIEKQQETIQQLVSGQQSQGEKNVGFGRPIANVGSLEWDATSAPALEYTTDGGTVVTVRYVHDRAASGAELRWTGRESGRENGSPPDSRSGGQARAQGINPLPFGRNYPGTVY